MTTIEVAVGAAAYVAAAPFNNRGMCDCGWEGERRWLRCSALTDACQHYADTRHQIG